MREWYNRALRWRAAEELEKARAKFWTNIDADINGAKSCELDAKRDSEEIRGSGNWRIWSAAL